MGNLPNLLAKLCEKPESDERPPGLKRKSTFHVSDNSDSVSEENSRKSGKRRLYVSSSEDNMSLYASGELEDADIDDIKMLTERSKVTGRNERETTANETN